MDKRDGFDVKETRIKVRCNTCGRNDWTLTLPEMPTKEIEVEGKCFCGEKYKVTVSVEWLKKNNTTPSQ
jgi:hypothetical protein